MNNEQLSALNEELECIIYFIKGRQLRAMLNLELLTPNIEQYKNASIQLAISSYVLVPLMRIKTIVESGNAKSSENIIRSYTYQIGAFGTPNDSDVISKSQITLKEILDYLINKYIEK